MFSKIKNGSTVEVYGFKMYLPPIGYGVQEKLDDDGRPYKEGKVWSVEKTDTLKRSQVKAEQYWEREGMPKNYNAKRAVEEKRQNVDPEYIDDELERFRIQEWRRRLRGVWIYINGSLVYLTGLHYFYLNYWQLDTGYPSYRDVDRRSFYMLQYVMEDPDCLGLIEVTGRRAGKTYRVATLMYEYISRNKNVHGGFQSKTDDDAGLIITKKIVPAWKKLPHFFRPIYDKMGTDTPKKLSFFRTPSKGRSAVETYEHGEELESYIDSEVAAASAYDSQPMHIYNRDEAGKLKGYFDKLGKFKGISVVESHTTVRYCCTLNRRYIGKMFYTTTVEEMADGGGEFKKLYDTSDQSQRNENNRTVTGLYRIFTPSDEYEGTFDKYGLTDIKSNRTWILGEREEKKDDIKNYYDTIRKMPLSIEEAFKFTGAATCAYNAQNINGRIDEISHWANLTHRGNLVWKNGKIDGEAEWVKNTNGRFELCWNFPNGGSNKGFERNGKYYPDNNARFCIACDPFKYKMSTDSRRSLGAAFVYRKADPTDKDQTYTDCFVMMYHARPKTASLLYEDMILMCRYFGCQILFESNVDNWIEHFKGRGYEKYLMKLPDQTDYGVWADEHSKTFANVITEEYIENRIDKVFFMRLLQQWLEFDLQDSQKYDIPMAAMWTLLANNKVKIKEVAKSDFKMTDLFDTFKIRA